MFGSGNNRFVLFAIGLGTFLALVGMATVYDWSSGTGRIHVVGPRDAPMTIFVDGVEVNAVGVGEHLRLELAQGPHEVRLVRVDHREQTHSLTIEDGLYEGLVPAPGQCFVELDVSESHYGAANGSPRVMGRYFAGAPEAYGGEGCSYSEASLPDSIPRTGVACLLVEIDCALASATDVALIGAALAPPGRIRM